MQKEKKPGLKEAYNIRWGANLIILSYVWPFFAVLIGGILIIFLNFPKISEKKFLISLGLFIILGLIINIIYYKNQRNA